MAVEPNYRADYRISDNKIIITGTNVVPPIEIPLSDLTQYKYINKVLPAVHNQNGSYADWVDFQKRIRTFDMIKDGHVARKGLGSIPNAATTICNLMYPASCDVPYAVFSNMISKIRSDVEQKTTKTTWTNANERFENIRKLDKRNTYKESGIGPEHVIKEPVYCTNIATEIIDPLKRNYPQNREKKRFPMINETFVITEALFNFFGLEHCNLSDRRIGDITHDYQLQIANGVIVTQATGDNWYIGNIRKNQYFKDHVNNQSDILVKKGLLNSKELGDVSQALTMFISKKVEFNGTLHSMVTGDEIVFIICILLGLDCIFYYHPRKSNHQIFHFKGEYKLEDAEKDFYRIRTEIEAANNAIMYGILEIINDDTITVELKGFTLVHGFRLSNAFLQDIIDDMINITFRLLDINPEYIYQEKPNIVHDDDKISLLIQYMTKIKEEYKLKEPFTTSRSHPNIATFSTSYKSYTQTMPTISDDYKYYLEGYTGKKTFYEIYKKKYNSVQGGTQRRIQKGGVVSFKDERSTQKWAEYLAHKDADTYRYIFELTFYPVLVTVKDKDFEELEIDSGAPAVKIDVHQQWKKMVDKKLKIYKDRYHQLNFYINDIWWELYNIYYIKNGDINEKQLNELLITIVVNMLSAHKTNVAVDPSASVAASSTPSIAASTAAFAAPFSAQPAEKPAFIRKQSYTPPYTPPRKPRSKHRPSHPNDNPNRSKRALFSKNPLHNLATQRNKNRKSLRNIRNNQRKLKLAMTQKSIKEQQLQNYLNTLVREEQQQPAMVGGKGGRRHTKKRSRNKTHRKRRGARH
jgi:hypothetical protein